MSQELRDALEQQVEEWRQKAIRIDPITSEGKPAKSRWLEQSADDIEELLQESENE